jgi:hypothetical protein
VTSCHLTPRGERSGRLPASRPRSPSWTDQKCKVQRDLEENDPDAERDVQPNLEESALILPEAPFVDDPPDQFVARTHLSAPYRGCADTTIDLGDRQPPGVGRVERAEQFVRKRRRMESHPDHRAEPAVTDS